jgi:hypothetical protein
MSEKSPERENLIVNNSYTIIFEKTTNIHGLDNCHVVFYLDNKK